MALTAVFAGHETAVKATKRCPMLSTITLNPSIVRAPKRDILPNGMVYSDVEKMSEKVHF
jgi:hypothetical protein